MFDKWESSSQQLALHQFHTEGVHCLGSELVDTDSWVYVFVSSDVKTTYVNHRAHIAVTCKKIGDCRPSASMHAARTLADISGPYKSSFTCLTRTRQQNAHVQKLVVPHVFLGKKASTCGASSFLR